MLKGLVYLIAQKVADAYELAMKTGNWWEFITDPYVILFSPVFLLMLLILFVLMLVFIPDIIRNKVNYFRYLFKKFLNKMKSKDCK